MSLFDLAKAVPPGDNRLWEVTHQPNKQRTPLKLTLRQRTIDRNHEHAPLSFTVVVGSIDTIADEAQIVEDAKTLLVRVGRMDEFVGIHEG